MIQQVSIVAETGTLGERLEGWPGTVPTISPTICSGSVSNARLIAELQLMALSIRMFGLDGLASVKRSPDAEKAPAG